MFFTFLSQKSFFFFQIKTLHNQHEFVNKWSEGIFLHVCNKFRNFCRKFFVQKTKLHAILRFPVGIICGPFWGSFPVWGLFAVGDHLRCCTDLPLTEKRFACQLPRLDNGNFFITLQTCGHSLNFQRLFFSNRDTAVV